jgi:hypothetical protein
MLCEETKSSGSDTLGASLDFLSSLLFVSFIGSFVFGKKCHCEKDALCHWDAGMNYAVIITVGAEKESFCRGCVVLSEKKTRKGMWERQDCVMCSLHR